MDGKTAPAFAGPRFPARYWRQKKRWRGFTLVGLLVAMALIMFIMALLSQAFIIASAGFRKLKGIGDLAERLHSAGSLFRWIPALPL